MATHVLDFERPLLDLERQIEEMKRAAGAGEGRGPTDGDALKALEGKLAELRVEIYKNLSPMQRVQVARHPRRPYTLDYLRTVFTDFVELHGDRLFRDDPAIVGGWARLDGASVMVIGHQKGRDTKENLRRNFGMAHPEGYRKALRLMRLAEKSGHPVITLVDTPGAYPGLGAEERGQAEAIARNLIEMAQLEIPIVTAVIGEGGSGGALAVGVADRVIMFENSVYSVISPEGCASILWKSADKAPDAAETLGSTANRLKTIGLIDRIIDTPPASQREVLVAALQSQDYTAHHVDEGVRELARLVAAMRVLISPLDYQDDHAWRMAVSAGMRAAVGSAMSVVVLKRAAGSSMIGNLPAAARAMVDAGVGHVQVEERGDAIEHRDHEDGRDQEQQDEGQADRRELEERDRLAHPFEEAGELAVRGGADLGADPAEVRAGLPPLVLPRRSQTALPGLSVISLRTCRPLHFPRRCTPHRRTTSIFPGGVVEPGGGSSPGGGSG